MAYELDTKLAIEKFSKIALKLRKKYGDNIIISLLDKSVSIDSNRIGYYMCVENVKKDNFCSLGLNYTLKEIRGFYREVTMGIQDNYIQIQKVCTNLIGKEVYLDKENIVIVEAITRQGVVLSNGETVEQNRLYIKESK